VNEGRPGSLEADGEDIGVSPVSSRSSDWSR
jgi:hypothetical protein